MTEDELNRLLPFQAVAPPLRIDAGGAVRVGRSRISLALIVEEYERGMTPEDIIRLTTRWTSQMSMRSLPITFGTVTR